MKFKLPQILLVTTSLLMPCVSPLHAADSVSITAPATAPDAVLEFNVRGMLAAHRNMDFQNLVVKVQHGSVLLMGQARNVNQKKLATQYIKAVEGVTAVINDLIVISASEHQPAGQIVPMTDADITARVKQVLLYHRASYAETTNIETRNGVVHFSSKILKPEDRDLVGMLVADTVGVKYMIDADDGITAYCADPSRMQHMQAEQLALSLDGGCAIAAK